jgi:hypothetical protein
VGLTSVVQEPMMETVAEETEEIEEEEAEE